MSALLSVALTPKGKATQALAPSQQYNNVSPGLDHVWIKPLCYCWLAERQSWEWVGWKTSWFLIEDWFFWGFLIILKCLWILIITYNQKVVGKLIELNAFSSNLDLSILSSSPQTMVVVFCLTTKWRAFYPHLLADENMGFQLLFPRMRITAIHFKKQFCHNFAEDIIIFFFSCKTAFSLLSFCFGI